MFNGKIVLVDLVGAVSSSSIYFESEILFVGPDLFV
jgi:hypothetical protein